MLSYLYVLKVSSVSGLEPDVRLPLTDSVYNILFKSVSSIFSPAFLASSRASSMLCVLMYASHPRLLLKV